MARLGVANTRLGAITQAVSSISNRFCSTSVVTIEQLLPQTDEFRTRHIGINSETEQEMTNFLGLEVGLERRYLI